jgi:putative phosphoribosyl transferase
MSNQQSKSTRIEIPLSSNIKLEGILNIPENPKALIIFAHGSGSGKESPRNQYVANILDQDGFASLLVDLLSPEEQNTDIRTQKIMCIIPGLVLNKFNISLLSCRLITITDTMINNSEVRGLPIGYYGASTWAAAEIEAAVENHLLDKIYAIVSRGGRPDLASQERIHRVRASTLLIVGSKDDKVIIDINKKALKQLVNSKEKGIMMVSGAGHLFEEEGSIEKVVNLTNEWFNKNLEQ